MVGSRDLLQGDGFCRRTENSKEHKGHTHFRPWLLPACAVSAQQVTPGVEPRGSEPTQTLVSLNAAQHKHRILTLTRYWGVPVEHCSLLSELDIHKPSRGGRYTVTRRAATKGTAGRLKRPSDPTLGKPDL